MCVHMPIGVVNNLFILTLCFIYLQVNMQFYRIKTHSSESRGQEEAGLRDEPVSYLQVAPL